MSSASHRYSVGNLLVRAHALVLGVWEHGANENESEASLREIAGRLLSAQGPEWWDDSLQALAAALSLDGLEYIEGHLLPSTAGAVAITPLISALEEALEGGFPVAANHYRQAVDNYVDGNHEAANGQLRSFLESLFIQASNAHGGQSGNAPAALQYLRQGGHLDDDEWQLLRGLWAAVQDNGPHHGMTSPEEALLRLHFGTSASRYLIAGVGLAG